MSPIGPEEMLEPPRRINAKKLNVPINQLQELPFNIVFYDRFDQFIYKHHLQSLI